MRRFVKLADTRSSGRKTEALDGPERRNSIFEELLLNLGQAFPEMDSILTVDIVGGDVKFQLHPLL